MAVDKTATVLIVDDEMANRLLLERLFARDFQVVVAASGEDALDTLSRTAFDLVLLDVMMPGIGGLRTLEAIRSNPDMAELPVILISALSEAKDVARGLKLGANDYVVKPIDVEIMRARVQTQLKLKRLQDERKQTIAELQAAQQMKDSFFHIASHDLKGPLSNIRMIHTLLMDTVGGHSEVEPLLDTLDTTLNHMQSVIEEFLDTAALQTGEIDLEMGEAVLDEVVAAVVTQYQLSAHRKEIKLCQLGSGVMIRADADRLAQALGNLVSNAIKFSPVGSRVNIWAECCEDTVRIHVADQGPGIPSDELNRLFTQFGKLTPRPTNGESSTGLGLWIVKHLIALQGGQVGVLCPAEGGSVFWIEMSLARDCVHPQVSFGARSD